MDDGRACLHTNSDIDLSLGLTPTSFCGLSILSEPLHPPAHTPSTLQPNLHDTVRNNQQHAILRAYFTLHTHTHTPHLSHYLPHKFPCASQQMHRGRKRANWFQSVLERSPEVSLIPGGKNCILRVTLRNINYSNNSQATPQAQQTENTAAMTNNRGFTSRSVKSACNNISVFFYASFTTNNTATRIRSAPASPPSPRPLPLQPAYLSLGAQEPRSSFTDRPIKPPHSGERERESARERKRETVFGIWESLYCNSSDSRCTRLISHLWYSRAIPNLHEFGILGVYAECASLYCVWLSIPPPMKVHQQIRWLFFFFSGSGECCGYGHG